MKKFVPLKNVESVLPILKDIAIWGGVSDRQADEIFKRLEIGTFKQGEHIFQKGDQPSHIYIVKTGRIALYISDDKLTLEKKTLSAGECFGVASLMAMQRHTNDAISLEESEVMVLSRQALLEFQHEDITLFALLMMNISRELARRLKLTDDILLRYAHYNNTFEVRPIGIIHSELLSRDEAPRQGYEGAPVAWVEVGAEFAQGLEGIAAGSDIILITWFHKARRNSLKVHPRGDRNRPMTGVFSTRSGDRPNPIALHRVAVLEIKGRKIKVRPLEAINGTPVLDIKPVLPRSFDS